jgi:hypothetical protein
MNAKTVTNGQARKSLAEQIDRLDAVLDGLGKGLNEAVADAVKEAVGAAVQTAVQAVLREVLGNAEIQARLRAPAPAAPPPAPKARWKEYVAGLGASVVVWYAAARAECRKRLGQVQCWVAGAVERMRGLGRFKYHLLVALGVGAAATATVSWTAPVVAAAAGWLAGCATTVGVQAALTYRRLVARFAEE